LKAARYFVVVFVVCDGGGVAAAAAASTGPPVLHSKHSLIRDLFFSNIHYLIIFWVFYSY
jgi:hypothetical protein